MKITIDRTPEQIELIKLMAHKTKSKAIEAQEAFAAFIGPIIQVVLEQAPVISNLYKDLPFDQNSQPSIPLDLYFDVKAPNLFKVWSQSMAGGMPSSLTTATQELFVQTYNLTSAVSFLKTYAQNGRIDVVAKALERMSQEILIRQEINSISPILIALAQAQYQKTPGTLAYQVVRTAAQGVFQLEDFNSLLVLMARINTSYEGGTPVANHRVTDMLGSVEYMAQVRSIAYEPQNTRGTVTNIPAAELLRDSIYEAGGAPSIYGINMIQVYEFGIGQAYNSLFSTFAGATAFPGYGGVSTAQFAPTTEEFVVAYDNTRDALLRPVLTDSNEGGTLEVIADDQFHSLRQEKIGFFSRLREGRVIADARALSMSIW
jgi:hypothetical protein